MELVYKNEVKLYRILFVSSLLFWALIIIGTLGFALLYLLLGLIMSVVAHSSFIAYLKGNGVKVSTKQYPKLYAEYKTCCDTLNFNQIPELYILNSDGILNALATRFLKKHYVILYSGVLDALKDRPDALLFYLGHELGHISQNHLALSHVTWPACLLPILGPAYRRAQEYTCDLHGLYCCKSPTDATHALAVIAGGAGVWPQLSASAFAQQSKKTKEFWMSFHEYNSDYPWLCKRMQHIMDTSQNVKSRFPKRSKLAFLLACFIPRFGAGSLVSIMLTFAILGILASVAIPAYQDYKIRDSLRPANEIIEMLKTNSHDYVVAYGEIPADLMMINIPQDISNKAIQRVTSEQKSFILHLRNTPYLENKTIILTPEFLEDQQLVWNCDASTLKPMQLPAACKTDQ